MRFLKTLIIGVFLGCVLGLWLGVNIGQDQNLFSNPLPSAAEDSQ